MRGALEKVDGVGAVNIKAGSDPNFTVAYDPAKVKPEALLAAMHSAGEKQVKMK